MKTDITESSFIEMCKQARRNAGIDPTRESLLCGLLELVRQADNESKPKDYPGSADVTPTHICWRKILDIVEQHFPRSLIEPIVNRYLFGQSEDQTA